MWQSHAAWLPKLGPKGDPAAAWRAQDTCSGSPATWRSHMCVLAHSPTGPRHQSKPPPEMEGGRLQACPGCSHRRAPHARTTVWIPGMVRNNNLKKVGFLLTKFRPVCCIGVVTEILCYYVTQSSRCYEGYKESGFFLKALQILKRHT